MEELRSDGSRRAPPRSRVVLPTHVNWRMHVDRGAGLAAWAVVCGAVASGGLSWTPAVAAALALTAIVALLGWGGVWRIAAGTDWFEVSARARAWEPRRGERVAVWAPPYTRPAAPAGRAALRLGRWLGTWRDVVLPSLGHELAGLAAAAALAAVGSLLLPHRLYPLHVALAALAALAVLRARRGRPFRGGQALVWIGLPWLAGHLAFAPLTVLSLGLSLCVAAAAWGILRVAGAQGVRPVALWLWNGGQVVGLAILVGLRQPLAAGVLGLLLLGQVALQPSLACGGDADCAARRAWPWLMAAMGVAALAVP